MKSMTAPENRKKHRKGSTLRLFALAVAVCMLALLLSGCWDHPGETAAEVNRRHERTIRLNHQMLRDDIDRALLLDKPSTLTDKRIP